MYDAQNYGGGRTSGQQQQQWGGGNNTGSPGNRQGGAPQGGANKPGGNAAGRAPIALRPVTIRMITEAQRVGDGAMLISGHEVGVVIIAGRVLEAHASNDQSANMAKSHAYKITDGTGVISVRQWHESASGAAAPELEVVGAFVVCTGTVKLFQDRPQLTGTARSMADTNELMYHLLESVNVHLRLTKGDKGPAGAKSRVDSMANSGRPSANGAPNAMQQQAPSGMAAAAPAGAGSFEDAVHKALMSLNDRRSGITIAGLHQKLVAGGITVSLHELDAHIRKLIDDGYYFFVGDGRISY